MAKVKFVFGSRQAFEALREKNADTIYVVNETGDFSSASLDADGDVYLGGKLLTGGATASPVVSTTPNRLQPNVLYQLGVLTSSLSVTLSGDFDENVKNEWHVTFMASGKPSPVITVNAPTILGYNSVIIGDSNIITGTNGGVYDVRVLYAGTMSSCPSGYAGHGTSGLPYKVFVLTVKCV